jgi:plastocyanin
MRGPIDMRRLSSALALISVTAVLAACTSSSSSEAGWTYAPAPSVTPAASVEASGSPAASEAPSEAPSATPEASESAGPSESAGASGGPELIITAPVGASVAGYDPKELEAPADTPFTIVFDNKDTGIPHNFVLKGPDGTNIGIGDTAIFNGPGRRTYDVPALAAGAYPFMCEVHPNTMTGTLTAG